MNQEAASFVQELGRALLDFSDKILKENLKSSPCGSLYELGFSYQNNLYRITLSFPYSLCISKLQTNPYLLTFNDSMVYSDTLEFSFEEDRLDTLEAPSCEETAAEPNSSNCWELGTFSVYQLENS